MLAAEVSRTLRYIEPLIAAKAPTADAFSILLNLRT